MTSRKSFRVIVAVLTSVLLNACSLASQNLTPSEFPWTAVADLPNVGSLYFGSRTQSEVIQLGLQPARRFLLETNAEGVTNVSTFVTVNGVEHSMAKLSGGSGDGLWAYQTSDICQSSYDYFFRLRYKAGMYGWKSYLKGSSSAPFTVPVSHSGEFVWYNPGVPPEGGNGIMNFSAQDRERRLYLQNLATTRTRVDLIGFSSGDPNFADFEMFDSPPMPVILGCGESMNFGLRYLAAGNVNDILDMLIKISYELGPGNWVENPVGIMITLKGGPGPG